MYIHELCSCSVYQTDTYEEDPDALLTIFNMGISEGDGRHISSWAETAGDVFRLFLFLERIVNVNGRSMIIIGIGWIGTAMALSDAVSSVIWDLCQRFSKR